MVSLKFDKINSKMHPFNASKRALSQWLGYSSMATTLLAIAPKADAQVVYTDLDPDVVLDHSQLNIDLDDDGVVDLKLKHSGFAFPSYPYFGTSTNASVKVPNGAVLGVHPLGPLVYASVLSIGAPISPDATNFYDAPNPEDIVLARHINSQTWGERTYGDWFGANGYLGFRFTAGDNELHYGWVQLAVDSAVDSVIVLAYGYERLANVGINAGDMDISTGIAIGQANSFTMEISPDPANDRALIHFPNSGSGKMELCVLDAMGQMLLTEKMGNTDTFSMNVADLAPGVYFVRLQDGKKVAFRKLVKQ